MVINMQIRVIFTDQSAGRVDDRLIDYLLGSGKIAAYYVNKWISVRSNNDGAPKEADHG